MITRRAFQTGCLAAAAASGSVRAQSGGSSVTAVDCHAHVFRRGLPLADARRYAPSYDATSEDYLKVLDANGISHAVLVQPSFFGTDNGYLVQALRQHPDRFRGVAVVDPAIAPDELRSLDRVGIVGIRLNLIGQPDPPLASEPWQVFLKRLADLDWQVEIQAEGHRWPGLLEPLGRAGVKAVADHFGKPDPALGVDDPGFLAILKAGRTGRVWVKLSGPYRNGAGDIGARIARAAVPRLRDGLGLERLVWGSDWPHTQFEATADYRAMREALDLWLPDPADRRIVLVETPAALFRLPGR